MSDQAFLTAMLEQDQRRYDAAITAAKIAATAEDREEQFTLAEQAWARVIKYRASLELDDH